MKIKIEISDPWKFLMVAALVDSEEFLQDISKIRQLLGISKLYHWEMSEDPLQNKQNKSSERVLKLETNGDKNALHIIMSLNSENLIPVRNKFNKSQAYENVFRFAILTGEVRDEHFSWIPTVITPPNNPGYLEHLLISPEALITVNPSTRTKDVQKAFQEYKKAVLPTYRIPKSISYLKRIRRWFWMHRNKSLGGDGMSYLEIALAEGKSKDEAEEYKILIAKSVLRYSNRIKSMVGYGQ
jgi:hypothetical protein